MFEYSRVEKKHELWISGAKKGGIQLQPISFHENFDFKSLSYASDQNAKFACSAHCALIIQKITVPKTNRDLQLVVQALK